MESTQKIICGDNIEVMKGMDDNSIDSIVTDAPYGLGEEPDPVEVMKDWIEKGFHEVKGKGFMGKSWDAFVPQPLFWKEAFRVLKPGGHVLCFFGTRTYDWGVMAMRFAGFEIRDQIDYLYGCLSDDTEVLTDNGFKTIFNLENSDKICIYDKDGDEYKWECPEKWNFYSIEDTAYRIKSDKTDQIVSRNHRCLIEREGVLLFEYAENLSQEHQARIPFLESLSSLSVTFSHFHEGAGNAKQELQRNLQTEVGCCEAQTRGDLYERGELPEMREAIQYMEKERGQVLQPKVQWASSVSEFETEHGQEIGLDGGIHEKLFEKDVWKQKSCMEGWNNLQKQERVLQRSEDKVCKMSQKLFSNEQSRWLCHGVQAENGATNGEAAFEGGSSSSYRPQSHEQRHMQYNAIQEQLRPQEIRSGASYRTTMATVTPIKYCGIIFCPTVSSGVFVARRSGMMFITGNSGFPKSLNIEKQMIKAGVSDDDAKQYSGLGTHLKPAHEPIVLARKPLSEKTVAANVLKHGTGGINIDGCRIESGGEHKRPFQPTNNDRGIYGAQTAFQPTNAEGRFPANLILDDYTATLLDEQSGQLTSGKVRPEGFKGEYTANVYGKYAHNQIDPSTVYGDTGGASRFFYIAKPDQKERNKGLRNLEYKDPASVTDFRPTLKTNPKNWANGTETPYTRTTQKKNIHPTVKPVALMKYLVKMVTPKGGLCLDPFNGSGTTGMACKAYQINYIGIEQNEYDCKVSEARIAAVQPEHKQMTLGI